MGVFKKWYLVLLVCLSFVAVDMGYIFSTRSDISISMAEPSMQVKAVEGFGAPVEPVDVVAEAPVAKRFELTPSEMINIIEQQANDRRPAADLPNYGSRILKCSSGPLALTRGPGGGHAGYDYNCGAGNADCGEPVYAVTGGLVTENSGQGYGKLVAIEVTVKDNKGRSRTCRSIYAHLQSITRKGQVGAKPKAGDQIGKMGKTGRSPTCHMHFEPCSNLYPRKTAEAELPWGIVPMGAESNVVL